MTEETGAAQSDGDAPETPTPTPDTPDPDAAGTDDQETFPRAYVEDLRRENAGYRAKAQRADALAERLLETTVRSAAAAILADPADLLLFGRAEDLLDDDKMPDADKITAAAHKLVTAKPHLATRRTNGDIGQGPRTTPESVSLANILRSRAG